MRAMRHAAIVLTLLLLTPSLGAQQTVPAAQAVGAPEPAKPQPITEEAAGYAVRLQLAQERIAVLEKALGEKGGVAELSTLGAMAELVLRAQREQLEARLRGSGLRVDWTSGAVTKEPAR